jgi:Family of unknown function (DUF6510)
MDARGDAAYDGNILAGPLSEIFAVEVTSALARCAGCGRSSAVAELAVFGPAPGLVARCPGCSDVMLRLVQTPDSTWLDLRGTGVLRLPAEPGPTV